jgi:short-subunit dehydrogenase
MTYIIVGGSAGLGRAIAKKFASEKNDLIIISSDLRDTKALASDLEIRYGINVVPLQMSLSKNPITFKKVDEALENLSQLSGLILPIGSNHPNDVPGIDDKSFSELVNTNFISVCLCINHFLPILKKLPNTTIIGFGSIATIRGRSRNATYAASKRALESYFESLRHFVANSHLTVQFYIIGYIDTNLSFGADMTLFKPAQVDRLADTVFNNRLRDFGITFYPKYWKIIKILLPMVPWSVFKKFKK